jgi:hypothetical protein
MTSKPITRRDFLKVASAAPLAGALVPALKSMPGKAEEKVRVVLVRDAKALDASGAPNAAVVQSMLDEAVGVLTGKRDAIKAWRTLVHPDDVVGIKTNVWGKLPTPAEVELAIKRRVMDAGVPEDKLSVDDRGVLRNPIFQNATALINARPARTHQWSGMGSCIKNYIQFVPQPSTYHGDTCADLATIWNLPIVKGKTRLNVLVMLAPLFHMIGTQQYNKDFTWAYNGLIVSQDPVAADATGLRVLEAKRREVFKDDGLLKPTPHHIQLADTRHHLGVSDPNRIELIKLGWKEGALI